MTYADEAAARDCARTAKPSSRQGRRRQARDASYEVGNATARPLVGRMGVERGDGAFPTVRGDGVFPVCRLGLAREWEKRISAHAS